MISKKINYSKKGLSEDEKWKSKKVREQERIEPKCFSNLIFKMTFHAIFSLGVSCKVQLRLEEEISQY